MTAIIYFLIWAALFFVMMRFGCGAHVMGHGHHHGHRGADDSHNGEITAPPWTTDPVCGMNVETAKAKSVVYDRHAYYFCSKECRDKFEANPQTYIGEYTGSSISMEEHHGTH